MKGAVALVAALVAGCADSWAAGPDEHAPLFADATSPVVHVMLEGEGLDAARAPPTRLAVGTPEPPNPPHPPCPPACSIRV